MCQRVGKSHKLIDLSVKETSNEEVEIEGINRTNNDNLQDKGLSGGP